MATDVRSKLSGLSTPHAAGAIVIGALILLILIRHGFRQVSLPGVASISVS